jgi:hypothetical protein
VEASAGAASWSCTTTPFTMRTMVLSSVITKGEAVETGPMEEAPTTHQSKSGTSRFRLN